MPSVAVCPDWTRCQQLAAGTLAAADEEALLAHLERCEACARKLQALDAPDALVRLMRQAHACPDEAAPASVERLVERLSQLRPGDTSAVPHDETLPPREPDPAPHLRMACTACGQGIKVKQELAGKKVRCPHCQQAVRVPDAVSGATRAPAQPVPPATPPTRGGATCAYQPPAGEAYDFLAPPQAPDELGRLGPYRVLHALGSGGMGVVFRAEDPHLARPVALKAMLPTLAASASARQRFLREARAAAAVKHDHIVTIHQVGEDRGVPFLAMEFLEGEPLDARLEREGKLPVAEVLRIGREVALGLAAAHDKGLVHRDIKPANLWLESGTSAPGGRVKVLDFGLARTSGEGNQLTQQGAIIGTPGYMAPEQAQGQPLDGRCDLFSLGCVLYRLATGQPAFRGTDLVSTLLAVATAEPPAPCQLDAAVPAALSDLIMALLAKQPGDRPASARAVADALLQISRDESRPPASAAAPDRPAARPAAPRTRRPLVLGLAAGLLLVLLAGLWAGGVLRVQTADGTIVLENVPADAEVLVDGNQVSVKLAGDGKQVEIQAPPGKRTLEIKVAGCKIATREVTIAAGERRPIGIRLEPLAAAVAPAPAANGAERRAARWVLALGGTVAVQAQGAEVEVRAGGELPAAAFVLRRIDLSSDAPDGNPAINRAVKEEDGLAHLEGLTSLVRLDLHNTKVTDAGLAHLKGLTSLQELLLFYCPEVGNVGLTHLEGLSNLRTLDLNWTAVTDDGLANLKALTNLTTLNLMSTPIRGPGFVNLQGLTRLEDLFLSGSQVEDAGLAHLRALPGLRVLQLQHTRVTDAGLAHLRGLANLRELGLQDTKVTPQGIAALKKALAECRVEATPPTAGTSSLAGLGHALWLARVRELPAGNVLDAVADRLRELNPGFDGKLEKRVEDGQIVSLAFGVDHVNDISPVQALPGLRKLQCVGSWERKGELADLRPLQGMKLTELTCVQNQVSDLSALQGMPLGVLNCSGARVNDLSPLKGMNLTDLDCSYLPITDLSPLKGMKLRRLSCWHSRVNDDGLLALEGMTSLHDLMIGGIRMTDAGFVHLKRLTELELLACSMMKLNGSGLVHLQGMTRLKYLWLAETEVTDAALVHVQSLVSLRELRLQRTRVTDAGLEHLAGLKNLAALNLTGTAVTDRGVAKLKTVLPRCNITR